MLSSILNDSRAKYDVSNPEIPDASALRKPPFSFWQRATKSI